MYFHAKVICRLKQHQFEKERKKNSIPDNIAQAFDKACRADKTTIVNRLFKREEDRLPSSTTHVAPWIACCCCSS